MIVEGKASFIQNSEIRTQNPLFGNMYIYLYKTSNYKFENYRYMVHRRLLLRKSLFNTSNVPLVQKNVDYHIKSMTFDYIFACYSVRFTNITVLSGTCDTILVYEVLFDI